MLRLATAVAGMIALTTPIAHASTMLATAG
jgi:hypothetical protein